MKHNSNNNNNGFDPGIEQVLSVLQGYKKVHPYAQIDARRRSHVSLRIRIIDPDFRGVNRVDHEKEIWPLLDGLPDDPFQDITMLILLTPEEIGTSGANFEFENPTPMPDFLIPA